MNRKTSAHRRGAGFARRDVRRSPSLERLEERTLLTTFTVTNTNDSGPGSFRQAILNINNEVGVNTIDFNIPGTGVQTIAPLSPLPEIYGSVVIDGYSQPGSRANTLADGDDAILLIQLSGPGTPSSARGLNLFTNNSTVQGLVINSFGIGIAVLGVGNHIQGNFLGTDPDGNHAAGNTTGILLERSSNNIIGGTATGARNVISGNGSGVLVSSSDPAQPATGNVIAGNFIGTDVTGTVPLGNFGSGVGIGTNSSGNTIGGTTAGARNIIAGNGGGIGIGRGGASGDIPSDNVIQGNFIGTDVTGEVAFGNGAGVAIEEGVGNTVGGTTAGARNIIAGNTGVFGFVDAGIGVLLGNLVGAPGIVTGNQVQGNLIGTNASGTAALPNRVGVSLRAGGGVTDNRIGGTTPEARNIISGNTYWGLVISPASDNVVQGNFIGTDVSGTQPLGNGGGVLMDFGSHGNTIGGTGPGEANIIAHSATSAGVWLNATGAFSGPPGPPMGNIIRGNSIHDNHGLGVDLSEGPENAPGVTDNDPLDTDSGPNGLQNFPVLTNVYAGASSAVIGSLHSTPSTTFLVDFYANAPADSTGHGEGQRWLGSTAVTTDTSGNASVAVAGLLASAPGEWISTTATGPDGTSEFSPDVEAIQPPSSISGLVFVDFNNDGEVDFGEQGIVGVTISLDGADFLGNPVQLAQETDADGAYIFLGLLPGSYRITETQPAGYAQGNNSVGTLGGSVSGDRFDLCLAAGLDALNYNFGERPASTGAVGQGQTAGIGFWNNKNGQTLIKALNGGSASTQLGNWLAATFSNMFGASADANNLAGKSNAEIAAFFQSRFVLKGEKLDAQVLATALAVYVTNATLNPTSEGAQYGFLIWGTGVGTATFNVGANGVAFGVADNTVTTVMDLLLAVDAQAVNGVLYSGNTARRTKANMIFGAINQAGRI